MIREAGKSVAMRLMVMVMDWSPRYFGALFFVEPSNKHSCNVKECWLLAVNHYALIGPALHASALSGWSIHLISV